MANHQLLLQNVHTFIVAAKTLSFTQTAEQLHLTQGAVSHRIRVLENELGFSLFVRRTRNLELTSEGKRFQTTVAKSLNSIFTEIDEINASDLSGEISIATSPGFATGWLVPRLHDFKKKYPKFNVNVMAQEGQQDFLNDEIDVAIYFGSGDYSDMYCQRLFGEKYIPVCSRQYAKEHQLFEQGTEALNRVNFIHGYGSNVWERWMQHMRLDVDIYEQFYRMSHRGLDILAAQQSVGLAMGRYHFVKELIEAGELVSPLPSMSTNRGYDLLCPLGSEKRPKIRTFIDWIEDQLS
ncbi:LysR substrate-binding domain-containing protein [Vibrio aestuarianus]|uniref:LysR substrate-binding domain-containing protein n=1 Tax=Vibrio aestuarianus TaxID=28171 RepID=UPI00237CBF6A|nr:LysR substrate-binding domain-containing protein [Vibrio aestuarianus]MDE1315660.1 LysR substrate-binding domain-containing protein [Vibrio aestuarianus]